jgi:penicillin-binding protein 1A
MATAYGTIASGGYRNRPTAITKVTFPDGRSELPKRWKVKRTKVFTDGQTYEATKILEQNIQAGTGTRAATGCPAAGKTGTTDRNTDAWFAGFTPRLATAVWVGYPNDRTEMHTLFYGGPVDGGTFPAAIWGVYMKSVIGNFCGAFKPPKEAFVSSPFFGEYSSTGGGRLGYGTAEEETYEEAPVEPAPVEPAAPEETAPSGGTEFDPEQYESAPQGAPETESP